MNKTKIINILLIIIFVFVVVFFALTVKSCNFYWEGYKTYTQYSKETDSINSFVADQMAKTNLSYALQNTFALIFSGLAAIATAVTFVLINPQIFKTVKKKDFDELKKDGE